MEFMISYLLCVDYVVLFRSDPHYSNSINVTVVRGGGGARRRFSGSGFASSAQVNAKVMVTDGGEGVLIIW